ncbi:MAG: hypothetical protein LUG61_07760 [Lachnospiraceae bacterium]|nr:hypothetical protein [Lachnospiraceae bacterium]
MNKRTKIVVLHMKEVIYTGIFIFLGIVLIVLLAIMFWPGREMNASESGSKTEQTDGIDDSNRSDINGSGEEAIEETAAYLPGIYSVSLDLSGSSMEMQVIIENTGISNVSFTYLDDAIQTMYPLFEPVLKDIASQLQEGVVLEDVAYEDSQKYTATVLLNALEEVLESARK